MFYPPLKEFLKLAKSANLIPVYSQINADLDTPVSAFLKIAKSDYSFLLESVEGQEKIARFSFLGDNPSLIFKSKGRHIEIIQPKKKSRVKFIAQSSPLDEIKKIMSGFKPARVRGLPRFYGGLVGYMGYDTVRFFEEIPDKNPDDLKVPDMLFMLTDTILVFDRVNHTVKIVFNLILPAGKLPEKQKAAIYHKALKDIANIERDFNRVVTQASPLKEKIKPAAVASNYKKQEFQAIVKRALAFIKAGDVIQVVLSQRFRAKINKSPFDIYRLLRSINPSPYMFFLKLKDFYLVGASPEILVRCEDNLVTTRPIAGTRKRGANQAQDLRLERELLNDEKEKAEHVMLVDLGRNDLGRVCKPSSIQVSEFMSVERYSHVMHLVTEVRGKLRPDKNIFDALSASFPAGTVSGSPKIRAMEIIDQLENTRRGTYAGCVGYFSFSGNMDTCITIRTILIKDNFAYVQAGAGIVADSLPQKEYFESVHKAKALIEAITK